MAEIRGTVTDELNIKGMISIAKGADGKDGKDGIRGPSGVYIGSSAPTEPEVRIWIDTDAGEMHVLRDMREIPMVGGMMSSSGYGSTPNGDSFSGIRTAVGIHVYPGSRITPKNGAYYQLAMADTPEELESSPTVITSTNTEYVFESEKYIKFGVRASNQYNTAALDEFDISLITDTELTKFARRTEVDGLAAVPMFRHLEFRPVNSFGQDTSYADVIGAFNALTADYNMQTRRRWVYADSTRRDEDIEDGDALMTGDRLPVYLYSCRGGFRTLSDEKWYPRPQAFMNDCPTIVLVGSSHGHEKSATYAMLYFLNALLGHCGEDAQLMWLAANCNFVLLPAVNPWGWENNNRLNARGVNINRNFASFGWADYIPDGAGNNKGAKACSEYETKIITRVVRRYGDAAAVLDLHTNGTSTDTWQQISAFRIGYDYAANSKSEKCGKALERFNRYLKPFMDSVYGTCIDAVQYGLYGVEDELPTLSSACADIIGCMSYLLELPCGGDNGMLPDNLSKYSSDVIRLCGEMLANAVTGILKRQTEAGLLKESE